MLLPLLLGQGSAGPATQDLTQAARFDNSQTFYGPTVTRGAVTLTPALYTNTQTFYQPVVGQGGAAQTLLPNRYDNTQAFYTPAVTTATALTPSLYSNAQVFYSATVSTGPVALAPARYDNAQTFYSATVTRGAVSLLPSLYENSQTFYSAIVSQSGGAQNLLPGLYSNTQDFYAFKNTLYITFPDWVEPGWVEDGWVGWPYFNQNQFFAPTVTQGDAPAQDVQRGDGVGRRWKKRELRARDEKLAEYNRDKAELRRLIERAIDPVQEGEEVAVVTTADKKAVSIVRKDAPAVAIPAIKFDARQVSVEIGRALTAANIETKRLRDAETKRMAEEAQRVVVENMRIRMKRRREEELMLLM